MIEERPAIMKAPNPWITYRTRFLVKARQLSASLTFTDALGRQHSGRKGDYLVEFSDGVLRIACRQIFEDIYVPMMADQFQPQTQDPIAENSLRLARHEPAPRHPRLSKESSNRSAENSGAISIPVHLARKAQPSFRDNRYPLGGSA
jgi:hypothetical protein